MPHPEDRTPPAGGSETIALAPLKSASRITPALREKALQMLALRAQGLTWEEIAAQVGYKSAASCKQQFYHAVRTQVIAPQTVDEPEDRLEGIIKPKVVRNLEALMDSTDERVKADVTLTTLKHVFREAGAAGPPPMTAIQVNLIWPDGRTPPLRDGVMGGIMTAWDPETE